ncbi:MAG: metal ABC transporter permease, partial [Planctomycetota bacterium]
MRLRGGSPLSTGDGRPTHVQRASAQCPPIRLIEALRLLSDSGDAVRNVVSRTCAASRPILAGLSACQPFLALRVASRDGNGGDPSREPATRVLHAAGSGTLSGWWSVVRQLAAAGPPKSHAGAGAFRARLRCRWTERLRMVRELIVQLGRWEMIDTWIVLTGALAAMACAVPGSFLMLRRQSMMGDALSHTALPGIVLAFLAAQKLRQMGWLDPARYSLVEHQLLFVGALVVGLLTALLTESVRRWGNVESSAAMGVVFTTFFALGLVLIRVAADSVHIDPDCVLYGTVETAWMETWGNTAVPRAVVFNAAVFLLNAGLVLLFYKELQVSTFDPALSDTLGISSRVMHYG